MLAQVPKLVLLLVVTGLTACTSQPRPEDRAQVTIEAGHYSDAFDAAVAVIRSKGLEPTILDRRGGLIETRARQTASMLEPWTAGTSDPELAALNTLGNTARRVRIEFSPAAGPPLAHTDQGTLSEPDLLGLDLDTPLTATSGPVDVRAWVWVERVYKPGRNLGSWTLQTTSWERPLVDDPTWETTPSTVEVPESRDRDAEGLLLAEIAARLGH